MDGVTGLEVRPFAPTDQHDASALVLAGLEEHWGSLDPALNPDLNDIAASYRTGWFLIGDLRGRIVATGGLVPRSSGAAEVVRLSVAADVRGRGIGRQMFDELRRVAVRDGVTRLILETSLAWSDSISFWVAVGMKQTHVEVGSYGPDAWFALDLR